MKRDIIFMKSTQLANALLATGKVKNEGNFLLTCDDNIEDMKTIQKACSDFLKNTPFKNYKLCFANSEDYRNWVEV